MKESTFWKGHIPRVLGLRNSGPGKAEFVRELGRDQLHFYFSLGLAE